MACASPLRAYTAANGGRVRFFNKKDWQYHVEPYTGLTIPCGTCILCRQEQARQWGVRITHEAQLHEENSFLTLTYADAHLPPHGGLRYADLVKFWKRARKLFGKLRYYACGEYGDKTLRPHYHAVVFGHSFSTDRIIIREKPSLLWTTMQLEKCWGLGQVSVGAVTFDSANYCASYVTKKLVSKQKYVRTDTETGELIALEQPRAFMSRNIARDWWEKWGSYAIEHDFVVIDGRKMKPPKAYDRWLAAQNEAKMLQIKEQRIKNAEPKTSEQLRARARAAHARARAKKKSV